MTTGGLRLRGFEKISSEKNPLFTVITVVYNAVDKIEDTIKSVISQSYENVEYIIIDGGSSDGTIDIIKKYEDKIDFWLSEKDSGIYDAMNKGIDLATGDWINFMNAGDCFHDSDVITSFAGIENLQYDVLFGDSVELDRGNERVCCCSSDSEDLLKYPTYRHGSSFVKASVHKLNKFDLSRKDLGFGLDYNCIYSLKVQNYKFHKIDKIVMDYEKEGVSANLFKTYLYIYRTTRKRKPVFSAFYFIGKILHIIKDKTIGKLKSSFLGKILRSFIIYISNYFISFIPVRIVRKVWYKIVLHVKIGKKTDIDMGAYFIFPWRLSIGNNTHINRKCFIDARGRVNIGSSVCISHNVSIMTASHDMNSSDFSYQEKKIVIGDYCFIGVDAVILKGVKLGKGCVVCAGAVVTKDVEDFSIVGGVPAKVIGKRNPALDYKCKAGTYFC